MQFEWDERKNELNVIKHHISFQEAILIFDDVILTKIDDRFNYQEVREISLGKIDDVIVIVVVHTLRNGKIRIISARKANKSERKIYHHFVNKQRGEL